MQAFKRETGVAVPLLLPNIDTDVTMPKQFLKRIDREGLAEGVFHDLRYGESATELPECPFNQSKYRNLAFIVAGRNFGCGSSPEHAVWGLLQFGIRAIIAPSFAGIFFGNCEKNGLLALTMPEDMVQDIGTWVQQACTPQMTVDLESCAVTLGDGREISFAIEQTRRHNLLEGIDHIEATLSQSWEIERFRKSHKERYPWFTARMG